MGFGYNTVFSSCPLPAYHAVFVILELLSTHASHMTFLCPGVQSRIGSFEHRLYYGRSPDILSVSEYHLTSCSFQIKDFHISMPVSLYTKHEHLKLRFARSHPDDQVYRVSSASPMTPSWVHSICSSYHPCRMAQDIMHEVSLKSPFMLIIKCHGFSMGRIHFIESLPYHRAGV